MKNILFLILLFISIIVIPSCSSSVSTNTYNWKYFRINASTDDDVLFVKLQTEMNIEPKMQSYMITVDLRDENPDNHKIIVGEPSDQSRIMKQWQLLSKETREGLKKWNGSNKFLL